MQLIVLSQAAAEKIFDGLPENDEELVRKFESMPVISITSPESRLANIHPKLPVLRLQFHDYDHLIPNHDTVLFNYKMANKIVDFLLPILERDKNTNDVILTIHCLAGVCRSAAVAAAIAKVIHGSDLSYFKQYCPNRLVHRILLEVLHERIR